MYIAVIALTMFLLPLASILADHVLHPATQFVDLTGRWFVFWGVGVRLGLAGLRQFFQPSFTARNIFHIDSDAALPLVREIGAGNLALAAIGLLSLWLPAFLVPAAVSTGIFYGIAGFRHT